MSKPIKLQKGDIVRGKVSGIKYTVIGCIFSKNSFRVMDCNNGNTGFLCRSDVRFVSRPGAAGIVRPKIGDTIRPIKTGDNKHSYVNRIEDYTGKCVRVDSSDWTCAIIKNGDLYWFKWSEVEIKPKTAWSEVEIKPITAEVAIDVNTASIESIEKALKDIDAQRDIIKALLAQEADKLIAKKKEAREEIEQKHISNMLNSIKSQALQIGLRVHGNLKGKGLFLSDSYNWNIVTDCDGVLVLVPTLKK